MAETRKSISKHDLMYGIVFDHLKTFRKAELESKGNFNNKPGDHGEIYEPFEFICDRLIRAWATGEQKILKARTARKDELAKIEKLVSLFEVSSIDPLSEELLTVTAINKQYDAAAINKLRNALRGISSLMRDKELGNIIRPILNARRNELASQDDQFGKASVVPRLVAEECRVIWELVTGQETASTYKNLDQHFPMFVQDVFDVLFANEKKKPSVRTALEKSASQAAVRIQAQLKLKDYGSYEIFRYEETLLKDCSEE